MNKLFTSISFFFVILFVHAGQDVMYLHFNNKASLGAEVTAIDSIYFNEDGSLFSFRLNQQVYSYATRDIDSITFGPASQTVSFHYENEAVRIVNPLAFQGVEVVREGAFVTVHATTDIRDIDFILSGATDNGCFKIYTEKRFNLILNELSITNPTGPAINSQSKKKTTVILASGTTNVLTDGELYADPPNNEDQKGTFFAEATVIIEGEGSLIIHGNGIDKHGLCSDDDIQINSGNITIVSAGNDGIHAKDGLIINNGTIQIHATGDGIDAKDGSLEIYDGSITITLDSEDVGGLISDSTILIAGGTHSITINGDQSKGIKTKQALSLSGGDITIHTTGNAVLKPSGSGHSPSYCTAIKSTDNIYLSGANITITSTGQAGKGISSDKDVVMTDGTVHITTSGNAAVYTNPQGQLKAYKATCVTIDNELHLIDGNLTILSSGIAGQGINTDKNIIIGSQTTVPELTITTTGTRLLISGWGNNAKYATAKAVKADEDITIHSGDITISSADDGLKANNSITINDCNLNITNSYEGIEAPYITFNGGSSHIKSSDDCLNATFGSGGEANDGSLLTINDGYIVTNSTGGDGIDSNGDVLITGGTLIIHGPPYMPEVGLDFNGSCNVHGGFMIISATNSFLIQTPDATSQQYSLKATSYQTQSSSTLFHLQNSSGTEIVTFQPMRNYSSIIFSSDDLQMGETYSIYTGGSSTGTVMDGLYTGGVYSGGTLKKTFTVTGKITSVTF